MSILSAEALAALSPYQKQLFIVGMETMNGLITAGWEENRKEASAIAANHKFSAMIDAFAEECLGVPAEATGGETKEAR